MQIIERLRKPEVLPPGNQWEFSSRNWNLHPTEKQREVKEIGKDLQEIITGLQSHFVADGWHFTSVVEHDEGMLSLVFVNPLRTATTGESPASPDFLKPEFWGESWILGWVLPHEPINELLKGTNLCCFEAPCWYNEILHKEQRGVFVKKPKITRLFQTGVAVIRVSTISIDEETAQENWKIDWKIERLTRSIESNQTRLSLLQASRDRLLALKVDNPRKIFSASPKSST